MSVSSQLPGFRQRFSLGGTHDGGHPKLTWQSRGIPREFGAGKLAVGPEDPAWAPASRVPSSSVGALGYNGSAIPSRSFSNDSH
jgi:hypothetical protein